MTNITIIGAGNMGMALARAISKSPVETALTIANRSAARLDAVRGSVDYAGMTTDIAGAASEADIVIIAVKPWAVCSVIEQIRPVLGEHTVVLSVAAGIGTDRLGEMLHDTRGGIYYAIPNTAVSVGCGITFITGKGNDENSDALIGRLLAQSGQVVFVTPDKMSAATALCSCGIAYVFKFIQAAVQAGVQMGFTPADAQSYFTQTVAGAVAMMQHEPTTGTQALIDAVTTPGGMTIKGINTLDLEGMPAALIRAILAPLG